MTDQPLPSPVALTGASGFIGSWITRELLAAGVTVHATVRDRTRQDKVGHLHELAASLPGKLELFDADLLKDGGFTEAFAGCRAVIHAASPFFVQGVRDAHHELIEPALEGTRRVLTAVDATPSVERVVLTSSIAAIHGDVADLAEAPRGVFDESLWNVTSSEHHQPYSYSKTLAEREAWKLASAQQRWSLVTINPGFVLGPALSSRGDATSTDLIAQMLDGRAKSGVPDLSLAVVDVRDVALAHLRALTRSEGRHLVAAQVASLPMLAAMLRESFGTRFPIPTSTVPKALLYAVGPMMGFSWKFIRRNVGLELRMDNSKSRSALGLEYRPIAQALREQAEHLESAGLLGSRR